MKRQQLRNALLMTSLLLFPVIMNYLSPYVIMDAASQGIVNGSLIFFTLLFLSSLFLGRFWCGWLCPGSGLNNLCGLVKPEPAKLGRRDLVKYVTWSLWIIVIAYLAYSAGGYRVIDPFYLTDHGISVTEPANYVIYFGIVGLILALNLVFGRGAMCHYLCWMAPFMVIGSRVKNTLNYPSLHLNAEKDNCINCGLCTRNCPRGLPVQEMVQDTKMNHDECILCGTCVDNCPKKAISYSWTK